VQFGQYAFVFDLDTVAMSVGGMSESQIGRVYKQKIPDAMRICGFLNHPQRSVYTTTIPVASHRVKAALKSSLKLFAPELCTFARSAYLLPLEPHSELQPGLAKSVRARWEISSELQRLNGFLGNYHAPDGPSE